ncbi:MAG: hypothetical protein ACLSVD_01830 [Eggerthellaceae bacterium]
MGPPTAGEAAAARSPRRWRRGRGSSPPRLDGGGRSPRSSRRSRSLSTKPTAGGARWALLFLVLYAACAAAWLLTRRNLRPGEARQRPVGWRPPHLPPLPGRDPAGDKLLTRNFRMTTTPTPTGAR